MNRFNWLLGTDGQSQKAASQRKSSFEGMVQLSIVLDNAPLLHIR